MSKSWENIYALVQSLTPAERGYFKKHWAGFSGTESRRSLNVFNLLMKMQTLDEVKLKKNIGGTANSMKSLRTHLYKQILRSLRLMNNDADVGFRLRENIDFIEILRKKGLYSQAMQILNKSAGLSIELKMQPYFVMLLIQQKQFLNQYAEEEKIQIATGIANDIITASQFIINREQIKISHLKSIYWNNVYVPLRDENIMAESRNLLQTLLLIDDASIDDYSEKNLLYSGLSNICLLHGNITSAIQYQQRSIDLMESIDLNKINRQLSYASALYNLASLYLFEKDIGGAENQLKKIRSMEISSLHDIQFVNAIVCCLQAQILQHNEAIPFLPHEVLTIQNQLGDEKPIPNLFYDTRFALMCYCVYHNQYAMALDISNDMFQNKISHSQNSFHVHVRLLQIIIHYKNNNILLLPFLIRSTYRFMLKQNLNYQIEKALLRYFRRIPAQVSSNEMRALFIDLLHEIQSISRNRSEAHIMTIYFNYARWLSMEIQGLI